MIANKKQRLIRNTIILSFGTLCTKGIMFFLTPLLTRWLSQNDYGIFDLVITYISLLIPFISLDCGEAVFRFLADSETDRDRKIVISSAMLIVFIGFLASGVAIVLVYILYQPYRYLMPIFYFLLLCESINTFFVFISRGLKKITVYTIANIFFVLSMAVFTCIYVKVFQLGIRGILLAYACGYIISSFYICNKTKANQYISNKCLSTTMTKKMLKFSIPLMFSNISWWIINVSDRTIVSLCLGTNLNAVYAVANKIPNLCLTIFNIFHISWQENVIESMKDSDRDRYFSFVMNHMVHVLISICAVILSVNVFFFKILFTEDYFGAFYHVPILVLAVVFHMLAQFIGAIEIARMESFKNSLTTILAAVINLFVNLVLIQFVGLYAATVSSLISYVVLCGIRFWDIRKNIDLRFERKTYFDFICLIYFFVACYLGRDIDIFTYFNIMLAMIYFAFSNRQYIRRIWMKMCGQK